MQKTDSPVNGELFVERALAGEQEIDGALAASRKAFESWRLRSVEERCELLSLFVDKLIEKPEKAAESLAWQMGRPISQGAGEIRGLEERARAMLTMAPAALRDISLPLKEGFSRSIRREALGVVFVVAPWNYPYLTAVNAVVPALAAGNAVILKHSAQTPLVAEHFSSAALEAGLPEGLLTHLHLSHSAVASIIADPRIDHLVFTGSVEGGHAVSEAAAGRFIGMGLELGGKDPAYVRADAKLEYAAATVIDGAMFNAGQSCCGLERAYVHESVFEAFCALAKKEVEALRLGNPLDAQTTLGPVVRSSAAALIRAQVKDALSKGARRLVEPSHFEAARDDSNYLAPELLVSVSHEMDLMREESFGPVLGVMSVKSDEEALALMNDSRYGLTAAIFSQDLECVQGLGDRLQTGTVFMNRCDYLDPGLAWTGVKDSGRGCSLSSLGYETLTRPKSFHFKLEV